MHPKTGLDSFTLNIDSADLMVTANDLGSINTIEISGHCEHEEAAMDWEDGSFGYNSQQVAGNECNEGGSQPLPKQSKYSMSGCVSSHKIESKKRFRVEDSSTTVLMREAQHHDIDASPGAVVSNKHEFDSAERVNGPSGGKAEVVEQVCRSLVGEEVAAEPDYHNSSVLLGMPTQVEQREENPEYSPKTLKRSVAKKAKKAKCKKGKVSKYKYRLSFKSIDLLICKLKGPMCPFCKIACDSFANLRCHIRIHGTKNDICRFCNPKTVKIYFLYRFMRVPPPTKDYVCFNCSTTFRDEEGRKTCVRSVGNSLLHRYAIAMQEAEVEKNTNQCRSDTKIRLKDYISSRTSKEEASEDANISGRVIVNDETMTDGSIQRQDEMSMATEEIAAPETQCHHAET